MTMKSLLLLGAFVLAPILGIVVIVAVSMFRLVDTLSTCQMWTESPDWGCFGAHSWLFVWPLWFAANLAIVTCVMYTTFSPWLKE
jgi:hypothetical protein